MKRVLTGLILIPTFAYVTIWAPLQVFLASAAIAGLLCFREYGGLVAHHNLRQPGLSGYVAGLLLLLLPLEPTLIFVVLIALLALALAMTSRDLAYALPFAATLVLGVLYVFGCLRAGVDLRKLTPLGTRGEYWLFFSLSVSWIGDSAAYYFGRLMGRHKLAPRISPAKSWEGAIASTIVSLVYAYFFFKYLLPPVPLPWVLGIAATANIAGQVGDLCESAIKRGAGVKDSGAMLPGHGGWLDRIDSNLFAMPVVYYLAGFVGR